MYKAFWIGPEGPATAKAGSGRAVMSEFERERQRILALQASPEPPTPTE